MPYSSLGGAKASYIDGALVVPRPSGQPRILVLGPAESGLTDDIYFVTNSSSAEREFGAATPVMRGMHEALAQGATNVSILRIGGRPSKIVFADASGNQVVISPANRDATILDRYVAIFEQASSANRLLVWDLEEEAFVYDSLEIEVINTDKVAVTGLEDIVEDWELNDRLTPSTGITLADVVVGDFTSGGGYTQPASATKTLGTDGLTPTQVERYAALSTAYHNLDYKDADYLVPVDAYVDAPNVADDASAATYGYFWQGVPLAGAARDKLGYLWQYVYRGNVYTYFTDTADYFTVSRVAATRTVATDLVLTCSKAGKGGNANTIQIATGGSLSTVVTENANGGVDILLTAVSGTTTTTAAATSINSALAALTLSNGVVASTLISAAGTSTVISATVAKTNFTSGAGGHVLTHEDLTGEAIPSAVSTRFGSGANAELRECNFAHQLASFCHVASGNWRAVSGVISFSPPESFGRSAISEWIGTLPEYTDNGQELFIDSTSDNGSGILGNKFIAGKSATAGYRAHMVTGGGANDSLAYGGFIMTKGASLPNGTKHPYGVASSDEALDANNKPLDIGKHLFLCADYVVHNNSYNAGSTYRGDICSTFVSKLATLPENVEPIGENGRVRGISLSRRIHSTQLDHLTQLRVIMLRQEEGGTNLTFNTSNSGAHPSSDYALSTTMRCANKHIEDIRSIVRPYFGKAFDAKNAMSIQSSVDAYCLQSRIDGFNQGAKAVVTWDRTSRILGRMKIRLKMVPPFSIKEVTVEASMAPDETEL